MNGPKKSKIPDINITPLVDVMLVLLVIFMIATPMMENSMKINLPKISDSSKNVIKDNVTIEIQMNHSNQIFFQNKSCDKHELLRLLGNVDKESAIILKIDKNATYGQVFELLDYLHKNGYNNLKLMGISS